MICGSSLKGSCRRYRASRAIKSNRQHGIALLFVVWVLALLSLMATVLLSTSNSAARMAKGALARLETETLLDSAANLVIQELVDPEPDHPWPVDGTARTIEVAGRKVEVRVRDEAGKIDLNWADKSLIMAALIEIGVSREEAGQLATALFKARGDSAGLVEHKDGTRLVDDSDAGHWRLLKSVSELHLVPGWPGKIEGGCLEDNFTIYTGSSGVDARFASVSVRKVLASSSGIETPNVPSPDSKEVDSSLQHRSLTGRIFTIFIGAVGEQNCSTNVKAIVARVARTPLVAYRRAYITPHNH